MTLLTRGGILIFSFAYNVILSRSLGAQGTGVVGALSTWVMTAAQIGNLGLGTAAVYYIGLDRDRARKIADTLLTSGILISLLLFAVFLGIGWVAPKAIGKIDISLYLIALFGIVPYLLNTFFQNLLLALSQIQNYRLLFK